MDTPQKVKVNDIPPLVKDSRQWRHMDTTQKVKFNDKHHIA